MAISKVLAPSVPNTIQEELKCYDSALKAIFNCRKERFEIYRFSRNKWHWVLTVENNDGTFRKLDSRILVQLHRMDIIERYGSIANYERHMDSKQKKWQDDQQKTIDHELRYDIKDNRKCWQAATENFRAGIINSSPEIKEKKAFSFSNGGLK